MKRSYHHHCPSGRTFALEWTDGKITSCVGDLHYNDLGNIEAHDYCDGVEGAAWANKQEWSVALTADQIMMAQGRCIPDPATPRQLRV